MSILPELENRFRSALTSLNVDPEPLLGMIRRSQDPKFGDYQANFAMSLGKQLGKPPRDVAAEIVAGLNVEGFCEGPRSGGARVHQPADPRRVDRGTVDLGRGR